MTGGIDKQGRLYINRPGKPKKQRCCYRQYSGIPMQESCTDFCPHFGDPEDHGAETTLQLCQGTVLRFTEFDDQR